MKKLFVNWSVIGLISVTIILSEKSAAKNSLSKGVHEQIIHFPNTFLNFSFENLPISKEVQKELQANSTINGKYSMGLGKSLKVFSSIDATSLNRFSDPEIFRHSPDVCWIKAGFIDLEDPQNHLTIVTPDNTFWVERRVYQKSEHEELCYFLYIVGGQGIKYTETINSKIRIAYSKNKGLITGLAHLSSRIKELFKDIFTKKSSSFGIAQFIRISLNTQNQRQLCDELLLSYLKETLSPSPGAENSGKVLFIHND